MRFCVLLFIYVCTAFGHEPYKAPFAKQAPTVDGQAADAAWAQASWRALDQLMLGSQPTPEDFSARYKVTWTTDYLYVMAEIQDDISIDTHNDPLDHYWDDDCFEVFLDADKSGGNHQTSHNAYAYHISLDNQIIDIAPDGKPTRFNHHVTSVWKRQPNGIIVWELAIAVYDAGGEGSTIDGKRLKLSAGKEMGFLVAYCDADRGSEREHFMGDVPIQPVNGDRNLAWITADVFGTLLLQ